MHNVENIPYMQKIALEKIACEYIHLQIENFGILVDIFER